MTKIPDNNQSLTNTAIATSAFIAGWEGQTYVAKAARYPLIKYIDSDLNSVSGGNFIPYVETALKQNNLKDKLKVIDLNESNTSEVLKQIGFKTHKKSKWTEFKKHILRLPSNENLIEKTVKGKNAFFSPKDNAIVCNCDKFGVSLFHETQHKLNTTSSNIFIKSLVKLKSPLAIFGPLVISAIALLTNKKNDGEKEGFNDKIKNNCGILTFICVLPHTIEEYIANIKGTTIAEKAGVTGEMLKKVKKSNKISMIAYGTAAVIAAFSAWSGNKIRDKICEYKK